MHRQIRNLTSEIRNTPGFTLVELLVVIAIIGILTALLLPAVQSAREAGRRIECTNHLKQIGLAMLEHESTYRFFSSGGYGWMWTGDPDHGAGPEQPGGWNYSILPFLEEQAVHEMGADGQPDVVTTVQRNGAQQRDRTVVSVFVCPSRRLAKIYPRPTNWTYLNGGLVATSTALDYAANCGTRIGYTGGPASPPGPNFDWGPYTLKHDGISYGRSQVKISQITDGTSHTYMVGEKYLNPDHYETGGDWTDDTGIYEGCAFDTYRWTAYPPSVDTPGTPQDYIFGSAHVGASNFVFCDGSVHAIRYEIDAQTHLQLGTRADGLPINESL
jgi:prepilin-type N-terminal cleavage/methylation domain-containing protein/prepilin-type processing-associated H-X9-DG protein